MRPISANASSGRRITSTFWIESCQLACAVPPASAAGSYCSMSLRMWLITASLRPGASSAASSAISRLRTRLSKRSPSAATVEPGSAASRDRAIHGTRSWKVARIDSANASEIGSTSAQWRAQPIAPPRMA